jgi:hypothetical protein
LICTDRSLPASLNPDKPAIVPPGACSLKRKPTLTGPD